MHLIGDLSEQDIRVLGRFAVEAKQCVIEFGCGGSTQIFATFVMPNISVISFDTSDEWIKRTQDNFQKLNIHRFPAVQFKHYHQLAGITAVGVNACDLMFNDGLRDKRVEFATLAWQALSPGGHLLWHDCRRPQDQFEIVQFVADHADEVETLHLAYEHSNLAVIKKRRLLPLEDWHKNVPLWLLGAADQPNPLPWQVGQPTGVPYR